MKANYGRKKKNLASVFSKFEDSHSLAEAKSNREVSKGNNTGIEDPAQWMPSISSNTNATDHACLNADNENTIVKSYVRELDDTTMKAQKACTRLDVSPSEFSVISSRVSPSGALHKPLPEVPGNQGLDSFHETPEVHVVEWKTTNLITVDDTENETEAGSFQPVSHSSGTSSGHTDTLSSLGIGEAECDGLEEVASYAVAMTATAIDLGNKVSSLRQHVNVEEQNAPPVQPLVKHREAKHLFKAPRLQKGREMFARAKRAISERLSSSASSKEDLKWHKANHDIYVLQSPSSAGTVNEKYRFNDNDANLQRLNRRLAEGANLSNPKIKALTGDGSVVRKPIPVHNGMKSPMHWSDSLEDPFSDEQLSNHGTPSPGLVDPNIGGSGPEMRLARRTSTHEPLLPSSQLIVPIKKLSICNIPEDRQYSDQLSGLRQHSDVRFFSSSPVGFSTPRYRLGPEVNMSGEKRLSVVQVSEPSLLDPKCDGSSEDEISRLPTLPKLTFNKSDLSLKRKNATIDQSVEPTPIIKKAKTEMSQLTSNLAMLNRSNGRPLGVRDRNQIVSRIPVASGTDRGLQIFQVPKGKERSISLGNVDSVKVAPNPKRSSNPVSFKSARSVQSQISIPAPVGPVQDDSLSTDELQME
ncbi:hypothetical protein MMC27_003025 [Xylographa pallens]|nr:hypothetical protein [Xylographa pallens]